jgi:hypothetical protein
MEGAKRLAWDWQTMRTGKIFGGKSEEKQPKKLLIFVNLLIDVQKRIYHAAIIDMRGLVYKKNLTKKVR